MTNAYGLHGISDESWTKTEFLLSVRKGTWGQRAIIGNSSMQCFGFCGLEYFGTRFISEL